MKRIITALLGVLLLAASTAHATTYALGTSAVLVGSAAGSNSVVLAVSPEAGVWTASTNAAWLHLTDPFQSGVGSTNVVFSFDANPGGPRSGTLTIAGQTLTVTQAGSTYVAAGTATLVSGIPFADGIAVDSTGNVYIAIANRNEIVKWTATNNTVTPVVTSGLNYPVDVAVDSAGNIYIADQDSGSIKRNTVTLVSGLSSPGSVAVDTAGNLYIADSGNRLIEEWTAASNTVTTLVSLGTEGIAIDGTAKNLYFSDIRGI
jgi:sugar lactone lactonase YvrE